MRTVVNGRLKPYYQYSFTLGEGGSEVGMVVSVDAAVLDDLQICRETKTVPINVYFDPLTATEAEREEAFRTAVNAELEPWQ